MGATMSKWVVNSMKRKECKILMVGLDSAGKTTILYKLRLGKIVSTMPTGGMSGRKNWRGERATDERGRERKGNC